MENLIENAKREAVTATIRAFNEGFALGRQYGEQVFGGEDGGA